MVQTGHIPDRMDRLYKIARIAKIAGIAKIEEQETQPLGDRDITEIEKARQLTAEAAENRERRLGVWDFE